MKDTRATIASLHSELLNTGANLELAQKACVRAKEDKSRLLLLPELMLTGHGAHEKMAENAEEIPGGPLSRAILGFSKEYSLCICAGIAELAGSVVYNSHMVADKGKYLGLQRKINLSMDEYCYFAAGESVTAFDTGDVKFGITICYDNHFPEIALAHAIDNVDMILCPHAARNGAWPEKLTPEFCSERIKRQQDVWELVHRSTAYLHNVYVLLCNAAGPSTAGLENVTANHVGTLMGIEPGGGVFLRTSKKDFSDEIATVQLLRKKRKVNHGPARNRRMNTVLEILRRQKQMKSSLYQIPQGLKEL